MPQNDRYIDGVYDGRKVQIIRPAASGDPGWDASKEDQVVIRFEEPRETTAGETPEKVVSRHEVKKA